MAALSYLSTYCLFRSFCSTPSCPGVGPSCALQWGRPGFKLASSPGLLGLTAPLEPSCIAPLKTAQRSQHCLSFTGACKQILLFIITDLLCHRQHCFEMEENHHSAFYLSKSVCLPGPKCVCMCPDRCVGTHWGRHPLAHAGDWQSGPTNEPETNRSSWYQERVLRFSEDVPSTPRAPWYLRASHRRDPPAKASTHVHSQMLTRGQECGPAPLTQRFLHPH